MKFAISVAISLFIIGNIVAFFHGLTLWLGNDDANLFQGVGPWMSGNGALGLLILGLIKLPREMDKWRDQAQKEAERERKIRSDIRLGEAAAIVLESVHRMANVISYITDPLSTMDEGGAEPEDSEGDRFLKMVNYRIQATKEDIQNFFDARVKAKMYFDEDLNGLLEELAKIWHEVKVDAHFHAQGLEQKPGRPKVKVYEDAFTNYYDTNKERSQKLEEIERQVSKKLKEYLLSQSPENN